MSAIHINLADHFAWAAFLQRIFPLCEGFAAEYRYVPSLVIAGVFFTLIRLLRERISIRSLVRFSTGWVCRPANRFHLCESTSCYGLSHSEPALSALGGLQPFLEAEDSFQWEIKLPYKKELHMTAKTNPRIHKSKELSMRRTLRLSRLTVLLLAIAFLGDRMAFATSTPDAATAKQQIAARGVGKGVKVHEADGTVLRGKIVSVGEDSFGVQAGSKPRVDVAFANVRAVDGPGLSKGAKIGIGIGIGVVLVVAIVVGTLAARGPGIHLFNSFLQREMFLSNAKVMANESLL